MLHSTYALDLVICTHNRAPLLDQCLNAISRQRALRTGKSWGVLVVDNACTDETPAVVESHRVAGRIPNLRLIRQPELGLTPARLSGVRHSFADWIAFVDDDCMLRENWVEESLAFAAKVPHCGAFGGRVRLKWKVPPPPFVTGLGYSFAEQNHGPEPKRVESLVGAGMVINRNVLEATGWLKRPLLDDRIGRRLVSGGDVEIALRLGARAELWYNPRCQLNHIIEESRVTPSYLRRINYGLGASQAMSEALGWRSSRRALLVAGLRKAVSGNHVALMRFIKRWTRGRPTDEAGVALCFWIGYFRGVLQIASTGRAAGRRLLGAAAHHRPDKTAGS